VHHGFDTTVYAQTHTPAGGNGYLQLFRFVVVVIIVNSVEMRSVSVIFFKKSESDFCFINNFKKTTHLAVANENRSRC